MSPPSPRISSSRYSRAPIDDGYDSSSSTESDVRTPTAYSHRRPRLPASTNGQSGPNFLLPPLGTRSSVSSATSTPVPSRSVSPLPQFYSSAPSSCTSDTESEPSSPFLGSRQPRIPWWREDRRRWWALGSSPGRLRSRRNRNNGWVRTAKKHIRRVIRHPLFPTQPISIVRVNHFITLKYLLICSGRRS